MNFNKKKLVVALATILSLNISVAEAVATGPAGAIGPTYDWTGVYVGGASD